MPSFRIAWRYLRTRLAQTMLTACVIALGVGLAICVVVLAAGLRRGLTTAGGPFELVVGPKGSPTQLVISSVLFQDVPIGNMTYGQYAALRSDARVRDAIPIALGDNVRGLRLIGTTPELFGIAITPERPPFYQLAQGQAFAQDEEAVLGSTAAEQLGLGVGATFISSHGVMASVNGSAHADHPYRVVGVLARTSTPADLGVYVPISSYWEAHGDVGHAQLAQPGAQPDAAEAALGVTAVLVRAKDVSSAYQLYQQLNGSQDLQAALPGMVLTQFLSLLGQGQQVLALITYVALGMAAISMGMVLYSAVLARRRATAVLRALGAPRAAIFQIALWESLMLGLLGAALGAALGHVAAAAIAALINRQSALGVVVGFDLAELPILLAMVALGLAAGLLPALRMYRLQAGAVLAEA